jgi:hypothetical protein
MPWRSMARSAWCTAPSFDSSVLARGMLFNDPFGIDGGGGPGPGSLYTDGGGADPALQTIPGALTVTERTPTPTSLSGFSFTCSTAPRRNAARQRAW